MAVAGEEEEEAESGEEAEEEQQQQQVLHQLARPNLRHTVNTLPNSNSNCINALAGGGASSKGSKVSIME